MKRKVLIIALILCGFGISSTFADSHMDAGKKFDGATSGYEGREDRLGRSMAVVLKSLNATEPYQHCLLYTSPSPRDATLSRMPSSA